MCYSHKYISIHTPLAGSDSFSQAYSRGDVIFQSTLPLRGVTQSGKQVAITDVFQSTLPLRGVTSGHVELREHAFISIHTPLAGSDRRNETFLTK